MEIIGSILSWWMLIGVVGFMLVLAAAAAAAFGFGIYALIVWALRPPYYRRYKR